MSKQVLDEQDMLPILSEIKSLKEEVKLLKKLVWQEPKEFISRADANKYFVRNGVMIPKSTFCAWWKEWQVDPRYKGYFVGYRDTAMLSVEFFHQWINDKDVDSILRVAS